MCFMRVFKVLDFKLSEFLSDECTIPIGAVFGHDALLTWIKIIYFFYANNI